MFFLKTCDVTSNIATNIDHPDAQKYLQRPISLAMTRGHVKLCASCECKPPLNCI